MPVLDTLKIGAGGVVSAQAMTALPMLDSSNKELIVGLLTSALFHTVIKVVTYYTEKRKARKAKKLTD